MRVRLLPLLLDNRRAAKDDRGAGGSSPGDDDHSTNVTGEADVVLVTQGDEATTGADLELLGFDDAGKYVAYFVSGHGDEGG
jgi:hypothetical protein